MVMISSTKFPLNIKSLNGPSYFLYRGFSAKKWSASIPHVALTNKWNHVLLKGTPFICCVQHNSNYKTKDKSLGDGIVCHSSSYQIYLPLNLSLAIQTHLCPFTKSCGITSQRKVIGVSNGLCEHLRACEWCVYFCEHEQWSIFFMRAASTLEITNYEQRALRRFSASWNLSL